MGKNKAKTAISMAVEVKPEVEITQQPKKSTFWPWFPIHSFRQFLAKTYCFATIQNVTDDRQTDRQMTHCTDIRSNIKQELCTGHRRLHRQYCYAQSAFKFHQDLWDQKSKIPGHPESLYDQKHLPILSQYQLMMDGWRNSATAYTTKHRVVKIQTFTVTR